MTRLLLLLLLAGCAAPGAVGIAHDAEPGLVYTGYVLADRRIVTVTHADAAPGDMGHVYTRRGKVRCQVVEVFGSELVLHSGRLRHGDSGAGVVRDDGQLLGVIYARKAGE